MWLSLSARSLTAAAMDREHQTLKVEYEDNMSSTASWWTHARTSVLHLGSAADVSIMTGQGSKSLHLRFSQPNWDKREKVQIPDDTDSWAVRGLDLKRQQNNINFATQLVLWASGNDCLRGSVYMHWAQKHWFFSSKGKAAFSESEWRAPGSWFTKAFCRWL